MKTNELVKYFKKELNKLSSNIEYEESIYDEDPQEEFFFYIQYNLNVCFYVFYDDWGMGLGINNKINNQAYIWYFEDFGITEESEQYKFMLKIMTDIVSGEKIFCEDDNGRLAIDFKSYKELHWDISYDDRNKLSIYEINDKLR